MEPISAREQAIKTEYLELGSYPRPTIEKFCTDAAAFYGTLTIKCINNGDAIRAVIWAVWAASYAKVIQRREGSIN